MICFRSHQILQYVLRFVVTPDCCSNNIITYQSDTTPIILTIIAPATGQRVRSLVNDVICLENG